MRSPFYELPPSRITHDNVIPRLNFQMKVNAFLLGKNVRTSGPLMTDDEMEEMMDWQDQGSSPEEFARELTARDAAKAERMMRTST